MASNHWVVHGDHTETGMPLLASDPHLGNMVPSIWLLFNIEMPDGNTLSGSNLPGSPTLSLGRSDNMVWAFTTSRCDSSDIWEEKLNSDQTEYFVDDEWRKLDVLKEKIKVQGRADRELEIKYTHRGPIIPFEVL